MTFDMAVGVPLQDRLAARLATEHPAHARTGIGMHDRIGIRNDRLFRVPISGMAPAGPAVAPGAGLLPIAFGGTAGTLPPELARLPQRAALGLIAPALIGVIALHAAAALHHHFLPKDGLLRRMRFGGRSGQPKAVKSR